MARGIRRDGLATERGRREREQSSRGAAHAAYRLDDDEKDRDLHEGREPVLVWLAAPANVEGALVGAQGAGREPVAFCGPESARGGEDVLTGARAPACEERLERELSLLGAPRVER